MEDRGTDSAKAPELKRESSETINPRSERVIEKSKRHLIVLLFVSRETFWVFFECVCGERVMNGNGISDKRKNQRE
jgi:hypothetical protein